MDPILLLLLALIAFALIFDFLNGFHDAANAIATIVISRTLTPLQAVIMAGLANFVGYFTLGTAVAGMIGKGVLNVDEVTLPLLLGGLCGAILWNIITWVLGLPTSSSHALIGGMVGAALVAAGTGAVIWSGLGRILAFIVIAPALGMAGATVFTIIVLWVFRKMTPAKAGKTFRGLQLVSSAFYSVGHGTNDAQKSMGIITLGLVAYAKAMADMDPARVPGFMKFLLQGIPVNGFPEIPHWVVLSCYAAISIGTMFGGWRIVKTMGTSITKIHQMEGFCSETAAAAVLLFTAHAGIPVSTTHVISGSIMGVGSVEGVRKVKWATARRIVAAWFITIPAAASMSAISYYIITHVFL
jgi:inorganic phosphate transporter, PiT family